MDHELQQLIEEQNKQEKLSDEDIISRCDYDDFEDRLRTSQSFRMEKPSNRQMQSAGPQNLKELNQQMSQKMRQKPPSQTLSQTQKIQKQQQQQPQQKQRSSVDNRQQQNLKALLDQATRDNQDLLLKCKQLAAQKKQLEQELQENQLQSKSKLSLSNSQRSDNASNSELKLLRIENDELKKVLTKTFDQSKLIKDLTLQVAKLKCKIDDLQQQK
ncbi:hypothetical protein pb186bvf_019160 [Paramecium bursaria]